MTMVGIQKQVSIWEHHLFDPLHPKVDTTHPGLGPDPEEPWDEGSRDVDLLEMIPTASRGH